MKITIVGAGNIGTSFAVHCAEKGNEVTIYTSKPEKINKTLTIVDDGNKVTHKGDISLATNNEELAFKEADLIFITTPAFLMEENAKKILPYARKEMLIGIIPGMGGGECAFKSCIEKGATVFGLQRVPGVARLVEYGKSVKATGYRDELFVASLPHSEVDKCCKIVEDIFDIKSSSIPNYLNLTLTPSNPILHTTRLKTLYSDYKEGVVYKSVPLFYEEWSDDSSYLLLHCDDEVQEICKKLSMFDLSYVKSLRIHYESPTPEALTKKMRSIKSLQGLTSPTVKVEGGYIPDLNSRYFTADFPFGLAILVQIADLVGVKAKYMKETLDWYHNLTNNYTEFNFKDYGINTINDLIDFYSK